MGTLAAILVFLLVFITPKFDQIYKDMLGGRPVYPLTRLVLGASDVLRNQWYYVVAVLVVMATGWRIFARTPAGRRLLRGPDGEPRRWVPAAALVVLMVVVIGTIVIALFMPLLVIIEKMPP